MKPITEKQSQKWPLLFLFSAAVLVMLIGVICNLKWGQAYVSWRTLYVAVTYQGSDKAHLYIQTLRLPRAIMACIVGMQLALAGMLTQITTKNPLASPHIFGINAGAALAVVIGLVILPHFGNFGLIGFAFVGAALSALLIWSLAGAGRQQYVRLALAGITIHFLMSSLTEGFIIMNQHATDSMIFWLVGSLNQAGWSDVRIIFPFFVGGMALFRLMLPAFKLLLLDDDIAAGLGQRVNIVRGISIVLVLLLAGSAVALCGPIGFICLLVPHIARAMIGPNLHILGPMTALLGGILLVYADFLSRFIAFPFESPVGIVTAVIGAPYFIYLARKQGGAK
ncbi:iron ABC transporter permease [Paenibacillus chondroitinus]|uniref:Iron ABC transporter permease n=1 Tax=Paenibacillus chondroitinus TaxID=59842 RepID=A0ABU6DPT9_9BACL|nr:MULTISPECIES: iron ABC transporter permease [Paenibacillus]MCY9663177.1 iron ABC transporter permease [Paenibacillus anseongense]MEB4798846.1 iron ABC transporter permease [Paenibacillus chondroitinus]